MAGRVSPKMIRTAALAVALLGAAWTVPPASAADMPSVASQDWSFSPPFGTFDRGQLQRGFKVYKEVCASCHGMNLLSYRNLGEPGGPEFSEEAVKAIAAAVEVTDGPNEEGDMFERPGKPSDRFVSPYRNDQEARFANGGALPPDLSVMAKARPYGPDYLYALLVGYIDPPAGIEMSEGMHYNAAFPGHQIAMPKPMEDDVIEYTDGTPATLSNYAKDVTAFMMWAAEPKLEERHRMGFRVMLYLIVLAGLLYFAKRKVWSRIGH